MRVRFSPQARRDLIEIDDWLARESAKLAVSVIRRLQQTCLMLSEHPKAYPAVLEYPDLALRKRVSGNYLIFYRVADVVDIVRIIHGARDYDALLRGEDG